MGVPYYSESDIFDAGVKLGLDPKFAGNGLRTSVKTTKIGPLDDGRYETRVSGMPHHEWLYEGMNANELKTFMSENRELR